jgi:uncharacterized membrane protein YhaH (DUF805 family)
MTAATIGERTPVDWALLPLKKYATFGGRAPRAEYWWFYLATIIVGLALGLLDRFVGAGDNLANIAKLALLLPSIGVTVRRPHDSDRSGWWVLGLVGVFAVVFIVALGSFGRQWSTAVSFTSGIVAVLVILAAGVTFLVFMVTPGTEGRNRYGPDPYGGNELEEVFA